ncbi:MAG: hypothetical protein U5K75_11015 [Ahrensia sp.]|nr:hypothetical protein [Ahrensia sp.]
MPITLPTSPFVQATPRFVHFATKHQPILGGEEQQINRAGSRFSLDVELSPRLYEQIGAAGAMTWISKLNQAMADEALFRFPQPGLNIANSGTPRVNGAGQGGTFLNADGFAANWAWRDGQYFNIIHGGNRYLHHWTSNGAASASGVANAMPIFPLLRISPDDNALIDAATPMIQGKISGDANEWTIDRLRRVGISFMIVEKR